MNHSSRLSHSAVSHKTGNDFSPLIFLASLGAGGIAVIPFALLQYTFPHSEGLIQRPDINFAELTGVQFLLHYGLDTVMILFLLIHLFLTLKHIPQLWRFFCSPKFTSFINNPISSVGIMAPFISIIMTMNVLIGPVRYFIPWLANNLQWLMLPALIFWLFIYVALLLTVIILSKKAFMIRFDINQVSFGWLLMPFALGMLTVTGTGFAALAESAGIAHTAAFLSLVSGTMGVFLLSVNLFVLFYRYFINEGLGEKNTLPSFLIVIPNITLYAIALFRLGHYLEHHHNLHLDTYFTVVVTTAFAFETWYLLFGIILLSGFFKKSYFQQEYYVTQWGLVCPFVAYAVLASFTYEVFLNAIIFYGAGLFFMGVAISFYVDLLRRYFACQRQKTKTRLACL